MGGDGGSDVGTHDDTNCLFELDDVCINKTDDDDGGGGRALYRCGDQCTKKHRFEDVAAHFFQCTFQTTARSLFKTGT